MFPTPSSPAQPDPAEPSAALAAALESFDRYYDDVLLPMWLGPGWNAQAGLCYEALVQGSDALVPASASRYRAMACARQLYTFARATQLSARHRDVCAERAAALCHALDTRFRDTLHGGWVFAIDSALAPQDTTKDLYTHAFVLFAAAHWLAVSDDPRAAALMRDAHDVITHRFTHVGTTPLPVAAMDATFSQTVSGVAQNPVMHLTEAYLAAAALREAPAWAEARVHALAEGILARFIDTHTGSITELPIDAPNTDNRIEPGHQFEWFYLVRAHAEVFSRADAGRRLAETLARAVDSACRLGVDADTHGVCLALNLDGTPRDASQRIWAQTEYGRALALCTGTHGAMLAQMLPAWSARFLHAHGWNEVIDATGQRLRADMPSSTPYHITTFYEAIRAALSGSSARCTQAVE
ncbi:AGE family epimerase/isomerase [Ralstonia mannitolilytica]|uniref:AGE family epimerase/isomerase n=1 Tax=Ralstonia mannitolilytica TaxID=105219 RepID=UPI000CEE2BF2|nr:AGE family epimerase/isomerase [Ralstonia mannitolilytica]MBU9581078.1 AGE family epimerase/isomerase [Ralstonia mannitolilytica]